MHSLAVGDEGLYSSDDEALDDILTYLSRVAIRWQHVGVLLGVRYEFLESLAQGLDDDSQQNMRAMIEEWLNNCDTVTLQRLVEAVEHSAGGKNPALAKEIRDKHAG